MTHLSPGATPTSGPERSREPLYLFVGTARAMNEWRRRTRCRQADVILASRPNHVRGHFRPIVLVVDPLHEITRAEYDAMETARLINLSVGFKGRRLDA